MNIAGGSEERFEFSLLLLILLPACVFFDFYLKLMQIAELCV